MRLPPLLACLAALNLACAAPPLPEWIWHNHQAGEVAPRSGKAEVIFLRHVFTLASAPPRAELKVCGDDEATVFLNGRKVVVARQRPADWKQANYSATTVQVADALKAGENIIAIRASNTGGPYGVIVRMEITVGDNQTRWVISGTNWVTTMQVEDGWEQAGVPMENWRPALRIGVEGDNPWFEVMNPPSSATKLTLPEGFQSETVRMANPEDGSWISMALDNRGRLIVSAQKVPDGPWGGMWRFTLTADGRIAKEEKIQLPVGGAQGLCYAGGALYVNGMGPQGLGLYRLRDSNGDDRLDHAEYVTKLYNRGGSHGPHDLELGPDGAIYHIGGDYTKPVDGTSTDSPYTNYAEDLLLPRSWDASGHARGVVAPMGTVQRFDPRDGSWKLFAGGLRNPYGLAFNEDGELFTYDADMEYDIGQPWYRPTRVYHLVSGGEYGHREGTGKWPYYYPDSLPPAVDVGPGSPVGLKFGTGSHFPPKYQRALFMGDWAWGNIFAVHFTPKGASYSATFEKFATGRPLNVVDLLFGTDGAMYFLTGGNDTRSGLFRISYRGSVVTGGDSLRDQNAAQARLLRRQLEAYHGRSDEACVNFAWPHLGSSDRFLRFAARTAIEWQVPEIWHSRALAEENPRLALTALLALARTCKAEAKAQLVAALRRFDFRALGEPEQLELLRVYGVTFARLGGVDAENRRELVKRFDSFYPSKSDPLNRELCMMLVFLEAPAVVPKTMALLAANPSQEQQVHYIYYIRTMPVGWTLELRRAYFEWFGMAAGKFRGGVSFTKFLANFKRDAIAMLSDAEKQSLGNLLADTAEPPRVLKPRPFVKEWTVDELLPELDRTMAGRNFSKGKAAYDDALCVLCHRMGHDGGTIGPDLTAVGSRFGARDLIEAIIAPSKIVMEQYQTTTLSRKSGGEVTGRLVDEDDSKVTLIVDPITGARSEVAVADIVRRERSTISPMPPGLVNTLTKEEILDLVAYLQSGGLSTAPAFQKQ